MLEERHAAGPLAGGKMPVQRLKYVLPKSFSLGLPPCRVGGTPGGRRGVYPGDLLKSPREDKPLPLLSHWQAGRSLYPVELPPELRALSLPPWWSVEVCRRMISSCTQWRP